MSHTHTACQMVGLAVLSTQIKRKISQARAPRRKKKKFKQKHDMIGRISIVRKRTSA